MNEITETQVEAYEKGKIELKELLEVEPEYLELIKGRAQFFIDGGHTERALIMLEMLEELDRTDAQPSLVAAELLLGQGDSDAAAEKIDRVLERQPGHAEALVALAELQIARGELVPAAQTLSKLIESDADGKTAAGRRALAVAARAHARFESV